MRGMFVSGHRLWTLIFQIHDHLDFGVIPNSSFWSCGPWGEFDSGCSSEEGCEKLVVLYYVGVSVRWSQTVAIRECCGYFFSESLISFICFSIPCLSCSFLFFLKKSVSTHVIQRRNFLTRLVKISGFKTKLKRFVIQNATLFSVSI